MDKSIAEYFVGQSAGYGGGAMTGGQVAPTNWAGTFSSNQTSRRLNDYPASRRYTYMQGNTVIGSSLYDTLTQDDLKHPKFSPQEIFSGLRKEMSRMEYPDKDVAKQTVLANLEKNPKFYSDLDMYFKSDKEGTNIMENIDPKELEMGIKVEKEHTEDKALAKKIAMDHLKEDPKYYTKLKKAGLKEDEGRDEFDFDDDEIDFGDESGDELEVGDDLGSGDGMEDSEESAADSELGSVTPIAPSIAVIKISEPIDANQTALASSGLGSGSPKPLRTDKLTAPTEKNKVGPNKVAVSRTPPVGGQVGCDPIDYFGSQMLEKW